MSTAPRFTELRAGGAGDLQTVARLMADSFDPEYGEAWTGGQCLGMLALPGAWLTLAVHDGAVSGFSLSRVIAGDGELLLIAVHPDVRGRGVGAALLRGVIAEARERSAERLHLEVRDGNPATALYRAHGFAQVGRRRDYYRGTSGRARDALTFALPL
ncbi:GNAT family N-acetyltransferase [Sphingomonas donggukensis]|uniref:GNAT family N-acetyltransferase n=1 Tax=Sphingomonas donggukensis TaxID=2949093 RepID=A0ABY4TUL7_9SPHN|nr:GNAT family N-acetyltransferase [Sphingomonas donggukensis]URW75147.1 GNAT family N-acetyltransferase [Sphingomonas donggukensis]